MKLNCFRTFKLLIHGPHHKRCDHLCSYQKSHQIRKVNSKINKQIKNDVVTNWKIDGKRFERENLVTHVK